MSASTFGSHDCTCESTLIIFTCLTALTPFLQCCSKSGITSPCTTFLSTIHMGASTLANTVGKESNNLVVNVSITDHGQCHINERGIYLVKNTITGFVIIY
jgi:hypothetical protein